MAGRLTTHVLDTARGVPASGMRLALWALDGASPRKLAATATNAGGRTDAPLLEGAAMKPGRYEIVFELGAYFRAAGVALAEPPFLDAVPVRFAIADAGAHYHVPLLASPWSYATYRGS